MVGGAPWRPIVPEMDGGVVWSAAERFVKEFVGSCLSWRSAVHFIDLLYRKRLAEIFSIGSSAEYLSI